MEIQTYNSVQLKALVESGEFGRMAVIPISTHRAISHLHNPRAEPEDVLMIIAYDGSEMIGYLGVLADKIYNTQREGYKCGWLSCMWVNPALRGKGIAKQLLATAFKIWNDHILVTEFTPEAKGLYDRSGNFNALRTNDGLRCYLRFNLHEVLPKKNERYKKYSSLLRVADAIGNVPNAIRLLFFKAKEPASLRFEQVYQIDAALDAYIQSQSKDSFERRDAADMNWIADYPWLIASAPTAESKRYHFSSVVDRFQNIRVRLMAGSTIKGYLHLTIRDGNLKIPYAFFAQEDTGVVVEYLYSVMLGQKLNMLTIFHTDIVAYLRSQPTPFLYKRAIKRNYIITKALDAHFADKDKLIIQDGDADCAFT